MEKLFTYGTLQDPIVQERVSRLVTGTPDVLDGYYKYDATFPDGTYPIIETRPGSIVEGKIIEVTLDELVLIDASKPMLTARSWSR